ncbi:aminopeptidase PepB [Thorsellia kenyensis]|uniref:Aminopeptidase PepB n=1 Tax=Thorsellia kenyensis TaxID=1549888 RepID=A0ABV6C6P3_9GAMM
MSASTITIKITYEPALLGYGKDAKLSFSPLENEVVALIHLNQSNDLLSQLNIIRKVARQLETQGIRSAKLVGEDWDLEKSFSFWQGYYNPKNEIEITFASLDEATRQKLSSLIKISGWTRDLINEPSDTLGPDELANKCLALLEATAGDHISYEKISGQALLEKGYTGLYTVGKGSYREPVYLKIDFNPSREESTTTAACLVGKGITFDTGGYSLKPSQFMESMKSDMGGAAMVAGSLALAILLGLKERVQLIICCADNMVSGKAFKLGDVIKYRNEVTVEVLNTDAEGRLVLADGLIDASAIKPKYIIDCATLTGAAKVALSNDYHAAFSFDDAMVNNLLSHAKTQYEAFWRLPLASFHREHFPSSFAKISNTNSGAHTAGASTAAAFLSYFVEEYQENWLHIDCSATYRKAAVDGWAAGATGIGIRTLADFLVSLNQTA